MRIVSLNCWDDRTGTVIPYLTGLDADIYCLQEIASSETLSADRGSFRINTRLFAELQRALPGHTGYFFAASRWYYESEYMKPGDDLRLGNAVFVRNIYPVCDFVARFTYGSFRDLPYGEKTFPSRAEAFRVELPSGKSLVVANMHGVWDPTGKGDTMPRIGQTAALLGLLKGVREEIALPTVVCGDFNLLPDSVFFKEFRTRGFTDLVTANGHTSTRTSHYTGNPEKKGKPLFADYMLVSEQVKVLKFEIVREPEVSDHCPLVLDIE
ncbi:MAG TPA: endonuclease/exonuclease/phosphatase family protein [Candidatus Paceibacterota bacterium]|nr:endonuclease/exonuclease/phosphatase family protein [Candidatus Paceibacterota bacterium]